MTTAVREAPHHRNLTCYTDYRCRRPECVERYNERNRARLRAHRDGTWNLVDAEPVRRHILRLQAAGIGPGPVAVTTGLPIQTVLDFIRPHASKRRGRRQRTTPEMAAKILAVTPENHVSGKVDATGTARRIQALVAIGWPLKHVALHAGLSHANMSDLLRRKRIFAATAKAIADTYSELSTKRPEKRRVDKGQVKRAKNWAGRQRWAPPKYWEQHPGAIDDPDFEPMYGRTRGELLAADARELLSYGVRIDQAAERLGVTRNHLQQELIRHPETETELAA